MIKQIARRLHLPHVALNGDNLVQRRVPNNPTNNREVNPATTPTAKVLYSSKHSPFYLRRPTYVLSAALSCGSLSTLVHPACLQRRNPHLFESAALVVSSNYCLAKLDAHLS